MSADPVVVAGVARTAIGKFAGSFKELPTSDLGAAAIKAAVTRAGISPEAVDEVILGCVGQVGEDAFNARLATLKAGLPERTTAYNVNRLCGSGLQAINSAVHEIRQDEAQVVVAGGNENMSIQPYLLPRAQVGWRLGEAALIDGTLSLVTDPFGRYQMGCTAEKVADRYGVSREAQDAFAAESQRRAAAAIADGRFAEQIVPVPIPQKKGDPVMASVDEHPRAGTSAESLARLRPAFREGGSVTAGNSSGINDAGAAVVLMRSSTSAGARGDPAIGVGGRRGRGHQPRDHGRGTDLRRAEPVEEGWHDDQRHRPDGAERGLRRPGGRRDSRAGDRP